jgi:hypothetical protein
MKMQDIMNLAEELSINKQFELLTYDYTLDGRHRGSYEIIIRDKPQSIYIDIGTSGKYIYDKNKGLVYSIKAYGQKNRPLGTPEQVFRQLAAESNQLAKIITQKHGAVSEPKPLVKVEKKQSNNVPVPEGTIFRNTWGYSMIINDYVMVVKDKDKTVDVVKLENRKVSGGPYWQQGTEVPLITRSIVGLKKFQLKKDLYNGEIYLRGTDKSTESSRGAVSWRKWDGRPNTYDYMD